MNRDEYYDESDNSKIVHGQTYEPNINDTAAYTPVLGECIYKFMDDAFSGANGFRDGTYIIPHPREVFYDGRRDLVFYENFIGKIITSMVDPVFQEPADRSITQNGQEVEGLMANEFLNDATNSGNPLQFYTWGAVETARLHGVTFTVVDNFPTEEQPETAGEAIDNRIFPYVYNKTADQVEMKQTTTDRFGNLTAITFAEDPVIAKDEKGVVKKQKRWWKWTTESRVVMTRDDNGNFIELESVDHNLGKIPVVSTYVVKRNGERCVLVDPPLYDIAKVNHAIFNKDSEIRDQERAQGFAVFYVQTDDTMMSATIGTKNVWTIPIEATMPPGFASPDPNILKGLVENREKLRESLFIIAGQHGVTGVADGKSGIAKQWDFKAHESVLQTTGKIAEQLELQVMEIFKLWTNEEFEYNVHYKDEFQPANIAAILTDNMLLLDMGLPEKVAAHVKKESLRLRAKEQNWDDEKIQELLEEFDKEPEDIMFSEGDRDESGTED